MNAKELIERYQAGERDFFGADLSGADLTNADLRDADFEDAELDNAIFCNTIMPDGSITPIPL